MPMPPTKLCKTLQKLTAHLAIQGRRGCSWQRRDWGSKRGSGQDQQVQPAASTRDWTWGGAEAEACSSIRLCLATSSAQYWQWGAIERKRRSRRYLERAGVGRRRRQNSVRGFLPTYMRPELIPDSYKIGDSFISLPLPEVQEMLSTSTSKIEEDVSALEEKLSTVREEMSQLKVELYARFGRSINLET